VCREPNSAAFETPPGLIVAARSQWAAAQGGAAMLPPSDLARDVQRVLGAMGIAVAAGLMAEEGLAPLQIALPDRCAAPPRG
jgi:hypothetical protein